MALITTIGGSTSDSYVTLAEADAYFAGHYSTAKTTLWNGLVTAQKESVLRRGCQHIDSIRVLDSELGYGSLPPALIERHVYEVSIHRLEPLQRLCFPRNIDVDNSNIGYLQQNVKDAQCEQSVYLISFDDAALIARTSGISSETLQAGAVMIHQTFTSAQSSLGGMYISPMVIELMRQFIRPTTRVVRA